MKINSCIRIDTNLGEFVQTDFFNFFRSEWRKSVFLEGLGRIKPGCQKEAYIFHCNSNELTGELEKLLSRFNVDKFFEVMSLVSIFLKRFAKVEQEKLHINPWKKNKTYFFSLFNHITLIWRRTSVPMTAVQSRCILACTTSLIRCTPDSHRFSL